MTDKILDQLNEYNFHDSGLNKFEFDVNKQLLSLQFEFWDNVFKTENPVDFQFKGISTFNSTFPENVAFVPEGCYSATFSKLNNNLYEGKFLFELHPNIDCWQVTIHFKDFQMITKENEEYSADDLIAPTQKGSPSMLFGAWADTDYEPETYRRKI